MIWILPVAALIGGSVLVGVAARRVRAEVDATAASVDSGVTALRGVSEELDRASGHLERLATLGVTRRVVRRVLRRHVPSSP